MKFWTSWCMDIGFESPIFFLEQITIYPTSRNLSFIHVVWNLTLYPLEINSIRFLYLKPNQACFSSKTVCCVWSAEVSHFHKTPLIDKPQQLSNSNLGVCIKLKNRKNRMKLAELCPKFRFGSVSISISHKLKFQFRF